MYTIFCTKHLNRKHFFRLKLIYVGSLTIFGISMFLLATFPSQLGVLILSVPAGIIYSTMLTIPFLLMAKYHACGSVSFVVITHIHTLQTNKKMFQVYSNK